MNTIRLAVVGVGNCASSLIQGIHYYGDGADQHAVDGVGLLHTEIGGYAPGDVKVVAAVDVDARKVGRPLHEACFAAPNNTKVFYSDFRCDGTRVAMGNVLDGVGDHMDGYPEHRRFVVSDQPSATAGEIEKLLLDSGAEILMNYLPVGSQ